MICITVAPTSRTLAKVDILNAMRYADIVEVALDHLVKEPDVKDLIEGWDKPVIVSCRRKDDGGQWDGSETDRMTLLRQAIVAGPAYIELDLDIASRVPRFGKTQRVISFTSMDRPLKDIDSIFDEAAQAQADVVKFCWPTPTLDDAWPMLAAVSQKRRLPIVGMGLGPADRTFSLLGRKYGSPWIYAALEKGMEAFPGQATVFDLDEIYHWREIDRTTAFIAVAGFGESQTMTTRIFNSAFKLLGANMRCLPIQIGNLGMLKKMLDVLKVRAILAGGSTGGELMPLADKVDEQDRKTQYLDLLMHKDESWAGYNTLWRTGLKALESALGGGSGGQRSLEKHSILVLGNGAVAESMTYALVQRKAAVSVCGTNDKLTQKIATQHQCRLVPFANLYDTLADVVVIADKELKCGVKAGCVNPSVFRPNQTVLDVSDPPQEHPLFVEATERGCRTVEPSKVYTDQLQMQFKALAGKDLPIEAFAKALAE